MNIMWYVYLITNHRVVETFVMKMYLICCSNSQKQMENIPWIDSEVKYLFYEYIFFVDRNNEVNKK